MRRWFSFLLLVMLPLQLTWVAAATYCQHEKASEAYHFGHHEHAHQRLAGSANADAPAEDAVKGVKLLGDNDCGYCQLNTGKLVQLQSQFLSPVTEVIGHRDLLHPPQTRDPERLERPNWRLA